MNVNKYDSIIIGGGTGGLRLAIRLSHKNHKVLMVEEGKIGGTCLNVGCIPTKALVHTANEYYNLKHLKQFGINVKDYSLDFKKMMERTNEIVFSGRSHIEKGLEKNENLIYLKGEAKFISENQIIVDKKIYEAKKIVIATGAKNIIVPIKGLDKIKYLSNENILDLKKLPKSIICIGGGYISCEFASFFASLGSKVTILEKNASILKVLDSDACEILCDRFKEKKINIKTNVEIIEVSEITELVNISEINKLKKKKKLKKIVIKENGKTKILKAEEILLAIGRAPNTSGLDLKTANINTGKRGEVTVNSYLQSSNPNVFAQGDVNGHAMFAHSAKRQTKIILNNIINSSENKQIKMNFNIMPWAVFTDPVISGVGLSEYQIKEKDLEYGILKSKFSSCGRAKIMEKDKGFVKIFYDLNTREILGSTIIGERADDLIHEIVAIMNSSSPTIDVIQETIHAHPTLSEVMENLK